MDYKVVITDKHGGETIFKRIIFNIIIDRRLDMQTANATVVMQDVLYKNKKLYDFTRTGGIIANGNYIRIYFINKGKEKIQFTGIIRDFSIDDEAKTINIQSHDIGCRILRPIDGGIPYHIFSGITATQLITNIANKAGLGKVTFDINDSNNYIIKKLKMQYDTQMSDIIDEALKTLEARARILKDGTYKVEKLYPNYKASDVKNNINYDWYYEDFIKIGTLNRKRGSETLYNRVLIRYSDNVYNVFEDTKMLDYVGYKTFKEVSSPLSDTKDKRQRVASRFFLDCWRENSSVDIVATRGNLDLDLGQTVRLALDGKAVGHYMVAGIRTELNNEGNYIDQVALDGMRENLNIAVLSIGNYTLQESKTKDKKKILKDKELNMRVYKGDSSTMGFNKIGYINIENNNSIEVELNQINKTDNDELWFCMIDPNGTEYGQMGNIAPFFPEPAKPKRNQSYCKNSNLKTCSCMEYSGIKSNPQKWRITNPIKGKWKMKVYSFTDKKEDNDKIRFTIKSNIDWTIVNVDGKVKI